jgi:hypothetical protein
MNVQVLLAKELYHASIACMRLRALLISAALLAATQTGHANGRFPLAQRFFQHGDDDSRLTLSATFGLLVSADRGENWYHVCESSFASGMAEGDALLELLPDSTMLAGIYASLNASSDCGCTWQPVAAQPENETIIDIAKSGTSDVLALIVTAGAWVPPAPPEPSTFRIARSTNSGKTWLNLSDLPSEVTDALTLDVAPSDASRVYVSAIAAGTGKLLVSSDAGTSWESHDLTGADLASQPYIAAVHPTQPDTVFVRTDAWVADENGGQLANDALLVSTNAGGDWAEPIRRAGKLFGFSLSADGADVVVGFGDPVQPARSTLSEDLGIYRATSTDLDFEPIVAASVSCLKWTAQGLYACFDAKHVELATGFALGFAANAALGSITTPPAPAVGLFEPLLRLQDVRGPLACNADVCLADWQEGAGEQPPICDRLGAPCEVDPTGNVIECPGTADGGAGPAVGGSGNAAGTEAAGSGSPSSGGNPASGGAASSGASATTGGAPGGTGPQASASPGESGCGCVLGRPASWRFELAAFTALLLLRRSRRRH